MAQEIALITGASSGIGEAFARRLARDGRNVALVARRGDVLERLAATLRGNRVEAHVIPADLTRPGAVQALAEDLERRGCVVDWLVNNAGFGTYGAFHELPIQRELEQIQLNVSALVELTGRFLPGMVTRKRGTVINIASVAGFAPGPYMATYCATKAFVKSFSEAVASEASGTGVNVLCVCPGFTRTEFQSHVDVDTSIVPSMAWQSAEEVADEAVRGLVEPPAVDQGHARVERRVQELADVGGVLLAVLVQRGHPVGAGRRHPRERRRVLTEVAGQPDERHERISRGEGLHDDVRTIDRAVVDQHDLDHLERAALRGLLRQRERRDLDQEGLEGPLPLVDGHDDGQPLGLRRAGLAAGRCGGHRPACLLPGLNGAGSGRRTPHFARGVKTDRVRGSRGILASAIGGGVVTGTAGGPATAPTRLRSRRSSGREVKLHPRRRGAN